MPDIDLSRRIVYPVVAPVGVERHRVVYRRDGDTDLSMDLYVPPAHLSPAGSPCVIFVHGGPIPREMTPATEWGVFISYGELAAAAGLVGVVCNHRLHAPTDYEIAETDMKAAVEYLRHHAAEFAVDADRVGVWGFSGGGPLLAWCLRERPAFLRCLVAFYAMLDVRQLLPRDATAELVARADAFSPAVHVARQTAALPLFVARAGRDTAMINDSIDTFVREALVANAPIDLANHAEGRHGFDVLDDDERSRDIIGRAISFVKARLSA